MRLRTHTQLLCIRHELLFNQKQVRARACNEHRPNNMIKREAGSTKCDRIWENPPYGINAQFAQCAFLVPRVKNCQSSDFVIYMSKNLSTNCYRRLRRLGVTY